MMKFLVLLFIPLHIAFAGKVEKVSLNKNINSDLVSSILLHINGREFSDEYTQDLQKSLELINHNSKFINKSDLIALINILFYQHFLNSLSNQAFESDQVTTAQIFGLKNILEEKNKQYTVFSTFIINSLYMDFSEYVENDFILHYKNPNKKESRQLARIREFKTKEKYLTTWIKKALNEPATQWNISMDKFILEFIQLFANRMKNLTLLNKQDLGNSALFSEINIIRTSPIEDQDSKTLNEQSTPESEMKVLENVKQDAASEVIDKIIEKIPN